MKSTYFGSAQLTELFILIDTKVNFKVEIHFLIFKTRYYDIYAVNLLFEMSLDYASDSGTSHN